LKHGGQRQRAELLDDQVMAQPPDDRLLALDEALERFGRAQPRMAELVKLRFFAGLSIEEVADLLGISSRTAKRDWTFARAWLRREMDREE
jgi:RNA polymerase sigma factor (TIGR02999 family)